MINVFKERPIQSISILLSIIGMLIMAVLFVEDRYSLKTELNATKIELKEDLNITHTQVTKVLTEQAITYYEDQLMELNYKENDGKATPFDKAKKKHIEGRLKGLRNK